MIIVVGGTWLYGTISLKRQVVKELIKKDPFRTTTIQPFDLEAHELIAKRYMESGSPEKAVMHLKRVNALSPKNIAVIRLLAQALLESGNYSEALTHYDFLASDDAAESIGPQECARRGIALFYLNQATESKAALESCIERFPGNAEALCFLGQIEASENLTSQNAAAYFNKAIAADSSYSEGWYQLARYYMELKLYTKARELLLTAVAINPFHSKSYSRLGMAYYYLDYPVLAKNAYQTSLVLNPNDFNTWYNLAELRISSFNDTVSALKDYQKALSLNPRLYEAAFKTGIICMTNNMFKEASRYFEQALNVTPRDVRILLQYAAAWEKLDRKDKAIEAYSTILGIDELNTIARQKVKLLAQP